MYFVFLVLYFCTLKKRFHLSSLQEGNLKERYFLYFLLLYFYIFIFLYVLQFYVFCIFSVHLPYIWSPLMHLFISEEGTESLEKTHNLPNKLTLVGWGRNDVVDDVYSNSTRNWTEVSETPRTIFRNTSDQTSNHVKQVSTKTRKGFNDLGLQTRDQRQGICHSDLNLRSENFTLNSE